MDDWLTIRVELVGRVEPAREVPAVPGVVAGGRVAALDPPPGRVVLVSGGHTFGDLAAAVDTAFGRWDLDRPRELGVEGRRLVDAPDVAESEADADLADVPVGEVGLRLGSRFTYLFDDVWLHACTVTAVGVDPIATSGVAPDAPRAVFGWGTIPDQDGRVAERDEVGPPVVDEVLRADWAAAQEVAAQLLATATADLPPAPAPDAGTVAAAVARVRDRAGADGDWAARVLRAVAGAAADVAEDPVDAWLVLAAAALPPADVPPEVDDDTHAAWAEVEPIDLAAAVVVLVRGGVGTSAAPDDLLAGMADVPEAQLASLTVEEMELLADGLDVVGDLWRAAGALDAERRLTALGRWGLPLALLTAWSPAG